MQLYTLGYEGSSLEPFLGTLTRNRITTLIDVRDLPLSRKRGFSKRALAAAAAARGIAYLHVRAVGCPKPIRDDYRADRDWGRYTQRYLAHLATQSEAMHQLARHVRTEPCVLVCYEADAAFCHRRYVAQQLQQHLPGLNVTHLTVLAQTFPVAAD